MSTHEPVDDVVDALRGAIERSDPNWVQQPSYLRRRLEEEFGPDARARRSEIHLLVVGAEERLPARLGRIAWSPGERDRLTSLLVETRGWTESAARWVVVTWAVALRLTDEVPPPFAGASDDPDEGSTAEDSGAPAAVEPAEIDPTILPGSTVVIPRDRAASASPAPPPPPPTPPQAPVETVLPTDMAPGATASSAPGGRVDGEALPTASTGRTTRRAQAFLGHDLDVSYEVKTGASPIWLVVILLVVGALLALQIVRGLLPQLGWLLLILLGPRLWPRRLLAIRGDHLWLLTTRALTTTPAAIAHEGTRAEAVFRGGWPFPSIDVGGRRLWFQYPGAKAARLIPTARGSTAATGAPPASVRGGPPLPATSSPNRRGMTVGAIALALVLGGALVAWISLRGDGLGPLAAADDPVVVAIAAEMASDEGDLLVGDPDESACVARRIVADLGPDRLAEVGVTASQGFSLGDVDELPFRSSEVRLVYEVLGECADLEANFATTLAANENMTEDEAACVAEEVGESALVRLLPGLALGDGDDEAELDRIADDASAACLDDEGAAR